MKLTPKRTSEIDQEMREIGSYKSLWSVNDLSGIPKYETIKKKSPQLIKPYILELLKFINQDRLEIHWTAIYVLTGLLRKDQNYTESEWCQLMNLLSKCLLSAQEKSSSEIYPIQEQAIQKATIQNQTLQLTYTEKGLFVAHSYPDASCYPLVYFIQQIEKTVKRHGASETLKNYINTLLSSETFNSYGTFGLLSQKSNKNAIEKLKAIVNDEDIATFKLLTDDIGDNITKIINSSNISPISSLHELLQLAKTVNASKPTKTFLKRTEALIAKIGRESYRDLTHKILVVAIENKVEIRNWEVLFLCEESKKFLKGIIWIATSFSDKKTVRLLSDLLSKCYEKYPNFGALDVATGNACAYTLGNMRGKDGLGALSRLKLKLKQNNIKKVIDGYLTEGAKKYGVSVEELKEMAVPDFHLQSGRKVVDFADYQLTIAIEDSKVTQTWTNPDGKIMKSVPSVVKNEAKLTQKLKDVRKTVKDIQKTYSAQKQRIDNQFILAREWDFASFDKYYLSHGLVATIATRLIWSFTDGKRSANAMWLDGVWQDATGETIEWIGETCTVSLWHPVFATETDIVAWRDRIMAIECKQPIKQAFRELYVLTDAEIKTKSYSNRMASHILKQHQFKTLAVLRDWKYSLLGAYDDGRDNETCEKFLPEHHLTAEFWIDELANYDDEYWNDAGIWYYISTDQVKFKNTEGSTLDLVDVPKIVFSEIMRDVDLFVGVCSVGNDPEWQDQNGERQQRDYWQSYSFGDLGEVARTRKAVLERLLPRLTKLKGKASIDGKFLIVEGKIRTYKIHIGSGNILMDPNDQYLCIVPARNPDKTTDKLFIPFEGDNGLSIVLSKAFMLAEDTKIKDETIISQIKGE